MKNIKIIFFIKMKFKNKIKSKIKRIDSEI